MKYKPITCPQCGHKYTVAEGSMKRPHMRNFFDIVFCPVCDKDYRV